MTASKAYRIKQDKCKIGANSNDPVHYIYREKLVGFKQFIELWIGNKLVKCDNVTKPNTEHLYEGHEQNISFINWTWLDSNPNLSNVMSKSLNWSCKFLSN